MALSSLTPATDREIMAHLGGRLAALREQQGLSAVAAAAASGLSRRTVSRAEHGENPTLLTIVRLLRLYGRLDAITKLLPEPEVSPMALLEESRGMRRARSRRGRR